VLLLEELDDLEKIDGLGRLDGLGGLCYHTCYPCVHLILNISYIGTNTCPLLKWSIKGTPMGEI